MRIGERKMPKRVSDRPSSEIKYPIYELIEVRIDASPLETSAHPASYRCWGHRAQSILYTHDYHHSLRIAKIKIKNK